jgi:uncharacterized protein with FMN-binding domain
VLSVYTAGYARTQSAAEQLNAAERPRPVAPAPPPMAAATPAPPPIATPIAAQPAPAPSAAVEKKPARDAAPRTSPAQNVTPHQTPEPAATPAKTPAPVATPVVAEPTPTPTPPPAPKWNDGSYSGWGRSRHGDIQATVAIENGKIVYVAISICDTRYPCDVIAKLPGQVLERQSPETDFVAGATESTNAFYYAVVEALKKAK